MSSIVGPDTRPQNHGLRQVDTCRRLDRLIRGHGRKGTDDLLPELGLFYRADHCVYFQLGYRIAQGERWPEWKPGDRFKAKRDELLNKAGR